MEKGVHLVEEVELCPAQRGTSKSAKRAERGLNNGVG